MLNEHRDGDLFVSFAYTFDDKPQRIGSTIVEWELGEPQSPEEISILVKLIYQALVEGAHEEDESILVRSVIPIFWRLLCPESTED